LNEFFVHHEDVRRANGKNPRVLPPEFEAVLWRNVRLSRRFLARRLRGAGLEIEWIGTNNRLRARAGGPTATVKGLPSELLLYVFGRQSVAQVEVTGSSDATEAVHRARFGM
jgi:uncharacterized protein (TIGR03085 family)